MRSAGAGQKRGLRASLAGLPRQGGVDVPAAPKDAGGNTLLVQNGYKPNGSTFESRYGKGDRRPGQQGRCYLYNGTNNYSTLDAGFTASGDFTLSFNINATSFASAFHVFSASTTNDRIYFNSGSAFVIVANGTLSNFTLDKTLVAGTWYNILIRRVSGTITVYVDGVAQSDTEANAQDLDFLYFSRNAALPLPAKLFDVRYFNSAITDAQLTYVVSQGRLGDAVTPTNWWKCDEQAGTIGYDSVGGNNLTHSSITASTFHATQDLYSFQNEVGFTQRMYFDRTDDSVSINHDEILDYVDGNIVKIEAKVQLNDYSSGAIQTIIFKNGEYVLRFSSLGELAFAIPSVAAAPVDTGTTLVDGESYKVAAEYNTVTDEVKYYIDDVLSSTVSFSSSPNGGTNEDLYFGSSADTFRLAGAIWDVNITINGSVVASYKGYGNTDADWVDQTGSNNGTVNGSPSNILFPRDESNTTKDVLGNTLQYSGVRPNDGALINSNCFTGNGINQAVRVADNTDLDITDNLTVCVWAKNDSSNLGVANYIMSKYDTGANKREWIIGYDVNEKLSCNFGNADGTSNSSELSDSAIDIDSVNHVAFTFESGTVKLYLNGLLIPSTTTGTHVTTLNNEDADLIIGGFLNSDSLAGFFDGQIFDARIYAGDSTVLTADQIYSIYNNPTSNVTFSGQTLKAHYKLAEGAGTQCLDASGNGNHGTIENAGSNWGTLQNSYHANINTGCAKRMYFDEVDDYVNFGSLGNLGVNCKVQFDFITKDSGQILFSQRDANRSCVLYQLSGSNSIAFYNSNGNIAIWIGTPNGINIRDGNKHTLVFEKNGNDLSVTIDGYTLSVTKAFADSGNTGDFAIGGHPNEISEFSGFISNVKVDAGNTGVWDLESNGYGNTNADWVDQIGSNDGTVNGSPNAIYIPSDDSSPGNDVFGSTLTNPAVSGHNNAETQVDFDPDSVPVNANIIQASDFDGSSQVVIADNATLDITNYLTVSCWAKNDSAGGLGNQGLIGKYETSTNQREWLMYQSPNKLIVALGDPADGTFEGTYRYTGTTDLSEWHHFAFTFASGTLKLYIDGAEVSASIVSGSIPSTLFNGTANLKISNDAVGNWNGAIEHCRIYSGTSAPLTAAQVAQVYAAPEKLLTFSGQTLVCAHELMSDTLDWSGNNLHGENNGITFTKYTVPTAYSFGDTLTATYNHFKREVSSVKEDRFLLYRESLEHNSKLSKVEGYTA